MILYSNAVPWTYYAGINDTPREGVAAAVLKCSPHTLLNPIKAPWGELNTPIAVTKGVEITTRFGEEVFDIDQPFYNYQSVLAEYIGKQGTPQYISRMALPNMAKSNSRLYIEYVKHSFPVYERLSDGGFSLDEDGNKVPTGDYADGYLFRYIAKKDISDFALGNGKEANGTLKGQLILRDEETGEIVDVENPTFEEVNGTILPILDGQGKFMGALGNRILSEIYAPQSTDALAAKTSVIEQTGMMMYRFGHWLQKKNGGGSTQVYGVNGEMSIDFCLKPDALNPAGTPIYFNDQYDAAYSLSEQTYTGANVHAPTDIKLYDENIAKVQALFHEAELKAKEADLEYAAWLDDENVYSVNIIEGRDHHGVPYHALAMAGIAEQPVAGYHSPYQDSFFGMGGGNDGDTSDKAYNEAVRNFCDNVTAMFPIWDMMQYQIGWLYDMGFEAETKKSLFRIMGENQSLVVVASTEEAGVDPKDYADTVATAIALDSAYGLYPESTIYKTDPTRGVIVPYACKIKNHKYRKPVPATFSLAKKMNDYLGASTGIWDPSADPMLERNKGIDEVLVNFESLNLPQRSNFWATQLVVMETIQHEVRGFTGLQTINGNDSSVLNNLMVVAATGQAVRAGYEAAVVFRGQTAPPSTIAARHADRITELCAGIDPTKAKVSVVSHQTTDDYNAGYAITDTITVSGYQSITAVTLELNTQYAED